MKSASAATIAILAGNQFTFAELYTITLLDGTVLRYTDADAPLWYKPLGTVVQSGTAQAAASTSLTLASTASATIDAYAQRIVTITSGAGATQERTISGYVGATKVATVSQWSSNSFKYSQDFTNAAYWTTAATASVINVPAVADPFGGAGTQKLVENTALNYHIVYPLATVNYLAAGAQYTESVYLKMADRRYVMVQVFVDGASNRYAVLIDLLTGAFVSSNTVGAPTGTGYTITNAGNGWWRVSVSCISTTTQWGGILVSPSDSAAPTLNSGVPYYTGNGVSGVYLFGAQQELGSVATPYIATGATPVLLPDATSVYTLTDCMYDNTTAKLVRDKTKLSVGIEVDNMNVTLYAGANNLVQGIPFPQFTNNGGFDGARLQVDRCFMATYGDTSAGVVNMFAGTVSDVKPSRTEVALTVSSDMQLLTTPMPRNVFSPACSHILFDAGCTVNKASYGASSAVAAGSTNLVINASLAQATGYFDTGTITFTSGALAGVTRTIKSYTVGIITLSLQLPSVPSIGDTFTAYAGCDKSQSTCNSKFSNVLQFRGFPYIPVPEASS